MSENVETTTAPIPDAAPAQPVPQSVVEAQAKAKAIRDQFEGNANTPAPTAPLADTAPKSIFDETPETPKEWFLSDKVKGEGDRPEWLKERYKTVEEQARAYPEAEKALGAFKGAPKDYDYDGLENPTYGITKDSESIKGFEKVARELKMSQDGFSKVMKYFADEVAPTMQSGDGAPKVDVEHEKKKLGADGIAEMKQLKGWLKNNFGDHADHFGRIIRTAEDVKAFAAIMRKSNSGLLPNLPQQPQTAMYGQSIEQVRNDFRTELKAAGSDSIKQQQILEKYKERF